MSRISRALSIATTLLTVALAAGSVVSSQSTDPSGGARVGYTASTAVAGGELGFAGRGFEPGEQVLATLDDGAAAAGPLVAGAAGEVAGVLALPASLRPGTHVLIVSGAASGRVAQTEVVVQASTGAGGSGAIGPGAAGSGAAGDLVPATTPSDAPAWLYLALMLGILVVAVALVAVLVVALARVARRRRTARANRAESPSATSTTT